jgi:tRNA pseudouridine32 synthase/23S rRNA pseudouridine746 synthase
VSFVYAPPTGPLVVLHRDRDLLAVHKPSGLLSVPGRGDHLADSLLTRVRAEYPLAQSVHRLDMDTSGVMVFALRRKAERELKRQFRERLVSKIYEARVWGVVTELGGVVDLPLAHDLDDKPKSKVCEATGKPARTRYDLLAHEGQTSRVRLCPETGRSHQLRVHMLALGHPILGDRFYAEGEALQAMDRLALQATSLTVLHPYRGEPVTLSCALDF